jgi:hypothetical protein
MSTADNNKEEKKKSNFFYISIISVETIIIALLTWQFFNQRTKIETIEKEKIVYVEQTNKLQSDLVQLKEEYQSLQTTDANMRKELDEKIKQIEQMQVEAEKHKNDAYYIYKLEKETETLRKIMKHFVGQLDSLGRLNKEIRNEKEKVETALTQEKDKTNQLTQEKEELKSTVALGSVLKASSIKVLGVKYKSGGKKETETTSAKRVEKIKITFQLGENKIAKTGQRTVFIRIVTPDGKELTKSVDESNQFKFNNSKGYFAAKTIIDYKNSDMNVTVYTAKTEIAFLPGKYLIEITTDEVVIGSTTLTLE